MNTISKPPPRVLVLLAAYNGSRWIAEQIDSILRQTGVSLHLVVRDDCSTDDTAAIVAQYRDRNVAFIRNESASGAAAQNFFALLRTCDASAYEFVALSDQDDIWNDDKLRSAADALQRDGSDLYSSATTAFWPSGRTRTLQQNPTIKRSDFLFEGAGQGCTFVLTAQFYRRAQSFLREQEPLTSQIHFHDWTLYALARSWGLRWTFNRTPTMRYRQHSTNDTGARASGAGIARRIRMIRSGWYAEQLQEMSQLCLTASQLSHTANDSHTVITKGSTLLRSARGWRRRTGLAIFCLEGGRRRLFDNAVLITSALLGWI